LNEKLTNFFTSIGKKTLALFSFLGGLSNLGTQAFYLAVKPPLQKERIFEQSKRAGLDSLPLILLVSLFIGVILALQTAYQLQRLGSEMYIASHTKDSKWCQFITFKPVENCVDYSGWGNNAELIYESFIAGDNASNVKFSGYCWSDVLNTEYSLWCVTSKNNFGCVNLKRKSYCILNKEYPKEKYEELKKQIIENMKRNPYIDELGQAWPYGEFFGAGFSKFAYNNSTAHKFFPKIKEGAIKLGYTWNDEVEQPAEATISGNNLPETISGVDNSILKEIISCTTCDKKYKIASLEFDLLQKMNIPLPSRCLKCREKSLFDKLQMPRLYDRECMKCGKAIRTSYAPERPEIIYCEKCYQQEIY